MSIDILSEIAHYKRQEVAERRAKTPPSALAASLAEMRAPRGFERALRAAYNPGRLALIAEIKKASPSRGIIREDFDPIVLAVAYAEGGASCLSILTDGPSFHGADAYLTAARNAVDLPCLRKDFLVDPWQVAESRSLGADAILVILSLVDDALACDLLGEASRLGMDALVETHDETEFERAQHLGASMIGINNRDLRTFVTDLAVTERLVAVANPEVLIVTESGIFSTADAARMARAGAHAMLVGESLMRETNVAEATRALLAPSPLGLDSRREHPENTRVRF